MDRQTTGRVAGKVWSVLLQAVGSVTPAGIHSLLLLTLGGHAQRGLQYLLCVCVSVCLSVTALAATAFVSGIMGFSI